jgi:deoxyribodipyrimidine photolyase-like uncharacterized protein
MSDDSVLWLLGDQLNPDLDALANADEVLLIEAHGFADRKPYHTHKLTLVFSAMRHARDALRELSVPVEPDDPRVRAVADRLRAELRRYAVE